MSGSKPVVLRLGEATVARTYDPDEYLVMHQLLGTISWNPRGHVLGIIGLSHISKKLAYKARTAVGMEIRYHEVVRSPPEIDEELQATFHATFHALLVASDCVKLSAAALDVHYHEPRVSRALAVM
ncbi:D-isomer specific 2-hydroxyacid dehydrogenase [Colletotrichum tabaci]|uniref:D-isomer specific 2-hydroxyacid dehydrogenase n=1 Tax=Colletotrichum tabaci TaxID=1209068 RepID=A0AAV9TEB8_9PEZI